MSWIEDNLDNHIHDDYVNRKEKKVSTISKIIDRVDTSRGAPMGRSNVIPQQYSIVDVGGHHSCLVIDGKSSRIFDCAVPMSDGAYDKGGAYWGLGKQLRVSYTKDLQYIKFYRKGDK